jgi:hypothetical protein
MPEEKEFGTHLQSQITTNPETQELPTSSQYTYELVEALVEVRII